MRFAEGQSWVVLEVSPHSGRLRKRYVGIEVMHAVGKELTLTVRDVERIQSPLGSFGGCRNESHGEVVYSITNGGMVLREEWRGLHIGSWCQNQVVQWVKSQSAGRIDSFWLSPSDARTEADRDRRNRFYEQFGIPFNWQDSGGLPFSDGRSQHDFTSDNLRARDSVPGVVVHDLPTLLGRSLWQLETAEDACEALKNSLDREFRRHLITYSELRRTRLLAFLALATALIALLY